MFMKKISSIALVFSSLLLCGSVAGAQGQAGQMARLKRFLALTDTQVADISALLRKHRETAFPLRQDIRALNNELRTAMDAPEPNPNTVGQLVISRRGLTRELETLNAKLRSDIAAALTPEQKQKFEQMKDRRAARRGRNR